MENKKFLYVSGKGDIKIQDLIDTGALQPGGKYYKAIVFAAETGQIWNHGLAYGMSIEATKTLINVVGNNDSGLVKDVNDIKNLIASDSNGVINKLSEVLQFFDSISDSETGKALLSQVAKNKLEIGVKSVPAIKYTQEEIDEAKTVIEAEGYIIGSNPELENIATKTVDDIKNVAVEASGIFKRLEDLENKDFSVIDKEQEGYYISKVSQSSNGKIEIKRTVLPQLSIKSGSDNYIGVNDHEVEIKTSKINNITLSELDDGNWIISPNNTEKGLAYTEDIAVVLKNFSVQVNNILNNHEEQIRDIEDWSNYDWEEI